MFGYEPNPIHYKIVVGSWEICSAIGLLFHDVRQMASVILGIMMLGAIQTYINLQEYTETIFPAVFFLTLCYIYGMTNRKSAKMKVKEDWSINYGVWGWFSQKRNCTWRLINIYM